MWVAKATTLHPELRIERMANEPGFSDVEHRRFIETMRHAGFPPCADPATLATVAKPLRLPECRPKSSPRPPRKAYREQGDEGQPCRRACWSTR